MTKDEHPTLNLTDDLDNSQLFESLHNYFVEQKKLTRQTNHLKMQLLIKENRSEPVKSDYITYSKFDIDRHSASREVRNINK